MGTPTIRPSTSLDKKLNSWLEKVKQDAKVALFRGMMYLVRK
jgi:hypothetical protein